MSHTKEPWEFRECEHGGYYIGPNDRHAVARSFSQKEIMADPKANAERIVSCVNACIGLTDPEKQIKALVEAARLVRARLLAHNIFISDEMIIESALEPFNDYLKGEG